MSLSDPIADFLTRLRNAQLAFISEVMVPFSNMNRYMLSILKSEGYISDFMEVSSNKSSSDDGALNPANKCFLVMLKYYSRAPVITRIFRVSKSGKRIYSSSRKIPKLSNGLGIYILSTSKGVMPDHEARRLGVGGEILCGVF